MHTVQLCHWSFRKARSGFNDRFASIDSSMYHWSINHLEWSFWLWLLNMLNGHVTEIRQPIISFVHFYHLYCKCFKSLFISFIFIQLMLIECSKWNNFNESNFSAKDEKIHLVMGLLVLNMVLICARFFIFSLGE